MKKYVANIRAMLPANCKRYGPDEIANPIQQMTI